jgi:hypothetical protein
MVFKYQNIVIKYSNLNIILRDLNKMLFIPEEKYELFLP